MTTRTLSAIKSGLFPNLDKKRLETWSMLKKPRPYLISCSRASNSGVEKNSPKVISSPSRGCGSRRSKYS